MRNLLVGSTRSHVKALSCWLRGFDPTGWDLEVYGAPIMKRYARVVLGRPIGDIIEDHHLWVAHVLRPQVSGLIEAFPGWDLAPRPTMLITDQRGRSPNLSVKER